MTTEQKKVTEQDAIDVLRVIQNVHKEFCVTEEEATELVKLGLLAQIARQLSSIDSSVDALVP